MENLNHIKTHKKRSLRKRHNPESEVTLSVWGQREKFLVKTRCMSGVTLTLDPTRNRDFEVLSKSSKVWSSPLTQT